MRIQLERIENHLKAVFERSTALIPDRMGYDQLTRLLVEAMQKAVKEENNRLEAPYRYLVQVDAQRYPLLTAQPEILEKLSEALKEAAQQENVTFLATPHIQIIVDPTLPAGEMTVEAEFQSEPVGETAVFHIDVEPQTEVAADALPQNAFLILEGSKTFPLRQPVINLGRRPDNHLIIDDPRVSRNHAQLRCDHGRFILFDLNSTGGTYVNGRRINQTLLQPGDVISLAGVTIIYGEDVPPNDDAPTGATPVIPAPYELR
jgi:hypothetical protein